MWNEADLVRRLRLALDLAARAVAALGSQGHTDSQDADVSVHGEKVVGETALLLLASAAAAQRHPALQAQVDAVARQLIPFARAERIAVRMCVHPLLARDYALAHCCLARLGYPDEAFDALVAASLAAEESNSREELPHHALERAWIGRIRARAGRSVIAEDGACARSMLGRPVAALTVRREDAYAFTHALMYVTDLGARRTRFARPSAAMLGDAEAALAHRMDADDFDLAGELLLTWPYLRRPWSTAAEFSFQVLADVEDKVGFLPAPITRAERYRNLKGEERTRYGLATAYHTAYVMGLLCAAMLCTPPRRATEGGDLAAAHDAVGALLPYLDGDKTPHWQAFFDRLAPAGKTGLAPWLLTIALQRAAASIDFAKVRTLLELAVRFRIAEGPAPRQAANLLRRAALYSSAAEAAQ